MVQHPADGDRLRAERLELAKVRHRLDNLVEMRFTIGNLDPVSQAEFEQLIRREDTLLHRD